MAQTHTRRKFLHMARNAFFVAGSSPFLSSPGLASVAQTKPKIAIADGAVAETALAMGIVPYAMSAIPTYQTWVKFPEVPDSVINLGARFQPNMELIAQLKPDMLLTSQYYMDQFTTLSSVIRIEAIDIYQTDKQPFAHAVSAAKRIEEYAQTPGRAQTLLDETLAKIKKASDDVTDHKSTSILLVSFNDPRHLRVFGKNSIMQDVLERMGLKNAWTLPTNYWGFETININQLASFPDARLVAIEPLMPDVETALQHSPILSNLPPVKNHGLVRMPTLSTFGGLYSAGRFASLMADALNGRVNG